MKSKLYDRIGGAAAVDAAVPLFYQKVLADDRLAPFFAGMDMARIQGHQAAFLTYAFGGPNHYAGRDLGPAHHRLVTDLGLTDEHFDAVIAHLGTTLNELDVPVDLITEAAAIAESTRGMILQKNT